jgi:hypothetical protein
MPQASTYRRMLDPTFFEHAPLTVLIRMTKLSVSTIGHHLNVVVRMKWPNGTWRKSIVIEDTQGTKAQVFWVVVLVEREMPTAKKRTILDLSMSLKNALGLPNYYFFFQFLLSQLSVGPTANGYGFLLLKLIGRMTNNPAYCSTHLLS